VPERTRSREPITNIAQISAWRSTPNLEASIHCQIRNRS
jgi:hypothetical protein